MLCRNGKRIGGLGGWLFLFISIAATAPAQSEPPAGQTSAAAPAPAGKPLTLEDAINYALSHYPAVRVALERQAAARGGVGLARTAYLPSANLLWQGNRATRNNIFGLLLPQSVIPSISGPVLPTSSNANVWGSAAAGLLSWEPVDFGYRRATVEAARANESVASADVDVTRLNVATATANAFFTLVAAQQALRAAQADVNRREVLSKSIHVLVDNQLRPGADASRADAELAVAGVGQIQAETTEQVSRAVLAVFLGIAPGAVNLDAGALLQLPPPAARLPQPNIRDNPIAASEDARVKLAVSQTHILDRSYYPRFVLQSSLSGRGTGANIDGGTAGGTTGLDLQRENWAVGLTASFPVLDFFSIRARKQIAQAGERAEVARYRQTIEDLTGQVEQAQAILDGARRIAQATPIELQAARDAESQARARYQAGLATVVEVTDAQSLLIRAEIDNVLAGLNTWRGLTSLAAAQGSLEPLLQLVRSISTGGH